MRWTSRSGIVLVATAAIALTYAPVQAHLQTKSDPNDTRGALDIRKASFSHRHGVVHVSLKTSGDWTAADLGEGSKTDKWLGFQFDSRGDDCAEYLVYVDEFGGRLGAKLYKWAQPSCGATSRSFVTNVHASRQDKTLKVKFAMRRLHPRDSYINWEAQSSNDMGTCTLNCEDDAPNHGWYYHRL